MKATSANGSGPPWLAKFCSPSGAGTDLVLSALHLEDKGTSTLGYRWDSGALTRQKFRCGFYPTSQTLASNPRSAAKWAPHGVLDTVSQLMAQQRLPERRPGTPRSSPQTADRDPIQQSRWEPCQAQSRHTKCAQPWKTAVSCTTT